MNWRQQAKELLERIGARHGRHRWGGGGRLVVLAYHRILPPDHGALTHSQPGMYVYPDTLRMHLEVLSELMPVVSLGWWVAQAAAGEPLPSRAAAITFDDGWRDNFDYAFPLLSAHGVPATMFLVTGKVGGGSGFWPERLARLLLHAGEAPGVAGRAVALGLLPATARRFGEWGLAEIDSAIEYAKRLSDTEAERRIAVLEGLLSRRAAGARAVGAAAETVVWEGPERELANWDEVRIMAQSGVFEFGSHTRNHIRLSAERRPVVLAAEIEGSKRTLRERLGADPALFCFPNGDVSPEALALVRRHYRAACTTRSGWNGPATDRWQLRRVSLHEDSSADPTRFLARLSGWF